MKAIVHQYVQIARDRVAFAIANHRAFEGGTDERQGDLFA